MIHRLMTVSIMSLAVLVSTSWADEVTQRIQKDLVTLGYDPGSIAGDLTVETAIAISKFQAAHGIEVTGEASPQLAGILSAKVDELRQGSAQAAAADPPKAAAAEPVKCGPTTAAVAQTTDRKARGFGRLASAFGRLGNNEVAQSAREAANVGHATADVASAVGDLAGDPNNPGC